MKNNDFKNYGTYRGEDVDNFKKRLEKEGIPVKTQYPGTNVGTSATGKAYSPAVTFLIRKSDFEKAENIRKKLKVERVGDDTPVPIGYQLSKKNKLIKFFGFLSILSIVLGIVYDEFLAERFPEPALDVGFSSFLAFFTFALIAIGIWFYEGVKKWLGN